MTGRAAAVSGGLGGALIGVGALALAGWGLRVDALRTVVPGAVAMNPLTAVAFAALGVCLVRLARRPGPGRTDAVTVAAATLVAVAAATRLLAYLGAPDAGLDRVLFGAELDAYDPPNRMAPNTAAAFLAAVAALPLVRARDDRAVVAGQLLALAVALAGLVTMSGYAFGLAHLMGPSDHIPMALPTGVGFGLAGAGLLLARTDAGIVRDAAAATPGGQTFRRIAPVAVLLPPVLAWLVVHGLEAGLLDEAVAVSLAVILGTIVLVGLLARNARRLNRADAARVEAERQTRALLRDLGRKSAELAAANAELESFSYSVSHDLRAPLRSITSFSQVLLEDHSAQLDAEGRAHLDRIVRAGGRMSQLIDDLIELARVSRGELSRSVVNLSALADDVVEELHLAEPQRDVGAHVQRGLEASADPRLVRVVLANLIGNAWKYTARVAQPRVEIGALPRAGDPAAAGATVFFVRDNGVGFDMQYADRLFTPFQRLHRAEEYPGTGVGLATVRRIVNRHGGQIRVESTPGAGTTFYFTLTPDATA